MKVLTNIDLNKNELQNVRLQQLSADPSGSNLVTGMFWMNTSTNPPVVKYYDGTNIITLGAINFETSNSNIKMNGTASVGNLNTVARADHVHPSDTSRVPTTRTINGKALSSNINLTGEDIALDSNLNSSVTSEINDINSTLSTINTALQEIGTAAFADLDSSISSSSPSSDNVPTSAAVVNYVSSTVGAADAMRFKGTIGTGGDITSLPTSGVLIGDTYRVITAGTYASQTCEVGDLIIAISTTPTWTVAQTNIDGAITSLSNGTGISITGSGSSRTVSLASGVVTAASKGSTVNLTPSWGGTFKVTSETVDTYGRTTALAEHTVTIPSSVASTSAAGLMSATDKSTLNRLSGIEVFSTEPTGIHWEGSNGVYTANFPHAYPTAFVNLYDSNGNQVIADIIDNYLTEGESLGTTTVRILTNSTATPGYHDYYAIIMGVTPSNL